jgi:hypothetical protein
MCMSTKAERRKVPGDFGGVWREKVPPTARDLS